MFNDVWSPNSKNEIILLKQKSYKYNGKTNRYISKLLELVSEGLHGEVDQDDMKRMDWIVWKLEHAFNQLQIINSDLVEHLEGKNKTMKKKHKS